MMQHPLIATDIVQKVRTTLSHSPMVTDSNDLGSPLETSNPLSQPEEQAAPNPNDQPQNATGNGTNDNDGGATRKST